MDIRTCIKCGLSQSIDEFYQAKDCKGGHRPVCKGCARAKQRAWYDQNRGRKLAKKQDP
jgi:hypothetical protein